MNYTIKCAENGFVVEWWEDEKCHMQVIENVSDDVDTAMSLFWTLNNLLGTSGSKHDQKRIRIMSLPGNDYRGELSNSELECIKQLRDDCNSFLEQV